MKPDALYHFNPLYAPWESDKAMPEHERINKSFGDLVEDRSDY